MRSLKAKLAILLIAIVTLIMFVPFGKVFAVNDGIQLVKATNGNIIIYVDGLEKESFDYALSEIEGETEIKLNYINSVPDSNDSEKANQVAVVTPDDLEKNSYLYVKKNDEEQPITIQISADVDNMFTQEKMSIVEGTTKIIATEVVDNLSTREETVNDVKTTYTVGGLKITDDQDATYSYVMAKLPAEGYSNLQNLANELNMNDKTVCEKIEVANEFYNQYQALLDNANAENSWKALENMQILQNEDYNEEENYVVLLKKVATDGTITYDAKFMKTNFHNEEKIEPAKTQEVQTKETSKLPITGDSIALFAILAVLVILAIIVYIRMRKSNKKADK